MKHLSYFLGLASLLAVACTENELPVQNQPEPVRHTIYAAMPQPDEPSRISVQNTGSMLWTPGDSFTAFNAENQSATFTLAETEYVKNGTFHSSDDVLGNFTYAAMPARYNPAFDGTTISFMLPNTYTVDDNSQNAAMWGNVTDGNVRFHHLMGVLKVYVNDLDDTYTKIQVEADRPIAGKFIQRLAEAGSGLIVDPANKDAGNNQITITRSLTHAHVYVPLPADTYSFVEVRALKTNGESEVLVRTGNKTVKCGFMYRVGKAGIDARVFDVLNLDYPGLEEVKTQYNAGNLNKAAAALLDYYRHRTNVVNPEIQNLKDYPSNHNIANQALDYRFMVGKFVEDDRQTADRADDIYYSFKNPDGSIHWDYKPNAPGISEEFVLQQHRHQWMEPQAKTYAVTKNEEYVKSWMEVYSSWMKHFPCPDQKTSDYHWKDLQTAARVLTQLNCIPLFIQSPNFTPEFLTRVLTAFARSVEYIRISYYEAGGNKYLTQVETVAKAGLLMPEFKQAEEWVADGMSRLDINTQFLPDGVHVDLSLGYHMGSIGSFLKVKDVVEANHRQDLFPPNYEDRLHKAVRFVESMIYPNYTVDNFNDSHSSSYSKSTLQNRLREYLEVFPDDEGLRWMAYEGRQGGKKPTWQNQAFDAGGYYMLRSKEWNANQGLMLIHSNNPVPDGQRKWHCQTDNGTFSLWYNGTNFLPDAGYYTYDDNDPLRATYRSYTMHNTLSCFTKEMRDSRRKGRMLHQASGSNYELIVTENMPYGVGDYSSIAGNFYHRRAIYLVDNRFVVLVDEGYTQPQNLSLKLDLNFHLYAEAGRHATIVTAPGATDKFALVQTHLPKNNLLLKCFSETSSSEFMVEQPNNDIAVSITPGKTTGEVRDYIRIRERKSSGQSAARFITVLYPSSGAANANQPITARFTDNLGGTPGTFHPEGSAVEVTVDGTVYKLSYTLSDR